jgi:3-deoxy-manno-octulosonate cytidylyltransferase (CMP-KDO synthetase)
VVQDSGTSRQVRAQIVIPARMASTRLPEKMLLRQTGKTLIQHTYEAATRSRRAAGVCVATDHERIAAEVRSFGGQVYMTPPDLLSGTDRVATVARRLAAEIIVNVQGDEPDISAEAIDEAIGQLEADSSRVMGTVATPIRDRDVLLDPACVKVVFDHEGRALYFSRSQIPYARTWDDSLLTEEPARFYLHMGVYSYRRDFLLGWEKIPPSPLERLESLEQLRVLTAGHSMYVGVVSQAARGIDTPADYAAFVKKRLAA